MASHLCWKSELLPIVQRFGERLAVVDIDGAASFREIFDHAAGIAQRLASRQRPDQPVATYFRNSRRAVAGGYATMLAGACEAALNAHLSSSDVLQCLETSGAGLVLTDRAGAAQLADTDVELICVEDIAPAPIRDLAARPVRGDDWARILFTSGTTGRPKGIVHSHKGRWTANLLLRATLPFTASGRNVVLLTPFSHGASLLTMAYLDGGGSVTLLDGLDVKDLTRRLVDGECDQLFASPTVLAKLLPFLKGRKIDGIRTIFCGTAPLSPELYAQACAVFGPIVRITYGKTEIFNPITVLTPDETESWYGTENADTACVGWPAPGVEVQIAYDSDQEESVSAGKAAPVLLRARHMLAGTLSEDGFQPHDADAFHRTGDIGFIDARGRLHLCGREADIIKTGGYRVAPEEVEAKLRFALPAAEFVVLGIPSAYWGEIIVLAAGGVQDGWEHTLQDQLQMMTDYKRPRLFAAFPELPRNAMGKVSRAAVREAIFERYTVTDGPRPIMRPRQGSTEASG